MGRVNLALVLLAGALIALGTPARAPTRPPGRTGGHRGARQTAPLPSGDRPGPRGVRHPRVLLHRYAFKTPTVRNVAVTAPYMHNGVFRTLDEVVEFYDRGGGAGLGIELPNQTLSPEPLRLTEQEKHDLVAFVRSLTDSAYEAHAPPIASRP
jgi:cytochrome c peroxidase